MNWLFQLNGIEEDTDNVFWDFGDGTTGEDGWTTEHIYATEGVYLVTAFVFTPSCQLVTVVTEIVIEGCNEEGCFSDDGVFYNIGDVLEVSDDWCENYTCTAMSTTGEFEFIINYELYPWECWQQEQGVVHLSENLPRPVDAGYVDYLVLDTNVVLKQIDLLELDVLPLSRLIIMQTVLEEVQHKSSSIYNRLVQ